MFSYVAVIIMINYFEKCKSDIYCRKIMAVKQQGGESILAMSLLYQILMCFIEILAQYLLYNQTKDI